MMKNVLLVSLLFLSNLIYSQDSTSEFGEWRLALGLPYLNSFTLNPENESRKTQTGWVGLEGGFEYQYNQQCYLSLMYSINGASEALGLMDMEGEFDQFTSHSVNLSNQTIRGNLSIGYGISLAQNTWKYTRTFVPDSIPPSRKLVTRSSTNLGLLINAYYQLGSAFQIGLIYRPFFWKIDHKSQFDYEHIISLDFKWRIRLTN